MLKKDLAQEVSPDSFRTNFSEAEKIYLKVQKFLIYAWYYQS